jgi:hypothetical protein
LVQRDIGKEIEKTGNLAIQERIEVEGTGLWERMERQVEKRDFAWMEG